MSSVTPKEQYLLKQTNPYKEFIMWIDAKGRTNLVSPEEWSSGIHEGKVGYRGCCAHGFRLIGHPSLSPLVVN